MLKKYDIVFVNLNPQKGHIQAGIRPCVTFRIIFLILNLQL